jgi:hypothetical protein
MPSLILHHSKASFVKARDTVCSRFIRDAKFQEPATSNGFLNQWTGFGNHQFLPILKDGKRNSANSVIFVPENNGEAGVSAPGVGDSLEEINL